MRCYDPDHLIRDVETHLQLQGLAPAVPDDQRMAARTAACQLLLAMGVTPAMDQVEALARASDKIWSEHDR